ncbi:MAG: urease accessory UreF family protein [Thermosynechococcaceae cyanobacterium]
MKNELISRNSISLDRRLALMQLSDTFFPSGSFTLSHGLESLLHSDQIKSPQDFKNYLKILLHQKVGPSDLVALRHAYQASANGELEGIQTADQHLFAQSLIQDVREAQCKSGRALLMVARSTWPHSQLDWYADQIQSRQCNGIHPVVFAVVGQAAGLGSSDSLVAFLHSFVTGLCSAAIRLGLLGHLKAQLILKEMAPELEMVMARTVGATLDEMWSCTPSIDIAQMQHQQLPQRQFTN